MGKILAVIREFHSTVCRAVKTRLLYLGNCGFCAVKPVRDVLFCELEEVLLIRDAFEILVEKVYIKSIYR